MNRRFPFAFKLGLSFAVVILLSVALVYFLTANAITDKFATFRQQQKQEVASQVCTLLGQYRARTGTWQGVDRLLTSSQTVVVDGRIMVRRTSLVGPFSIADANGRIVVSTSKENIGDIKSARDTGGIPIDFQERQVGTLFIHNQGTLFDPIEEQFLRSAKRSALLGGGIASGVALLLSVFLISQVLSPLRVLSRATEKIARGDLTYRVKLHARDEFGQLGKAFNRMVNRLRRSEEIRQTMTADIAHELRTPVTIIQGNLEAILDGIYEPNSTAITPIYEETLHLSQLVEDLRELSLAEAGELELNREPADLGQITKRVVDSISASAADAVRIVVDVDPNLPLVSVDIKRFRQVLVNLLSNAVRYTPNGETIHVELVYRRDNVELQVVDGGPGISEDDLPHLFERFYRGDRARTRSHGGSGLGLAIAKQYVEAHGGEIRAENCETKGARFVILLPAV